jgi:hypothetical protein
LLPASAEPDVQVRARQGGFVMDQRIEKDVLTPEQQEQVQRLDDLISRIDRRQRFAGRVTQQLIDHPVRFSAIALGVAGLAAGFIVVLVHRRRQRPLGQISSAAASLLARRLTERLIERIT